jgi:Zn-dependent protease/CBS domain-containing protein
MGSSLRLFAVRGIDIRMHITFPLILLWGAIQFGVNIGQGAAGAVFGVVVTLLLFAIVILHELGHSFAAQYYDVPVKQIILLPIGGVAQLGRIPEQPIQEFIIAIAGPAVNFVIAGILALFGWILNLDLGLGSMQGVFAQLGQANLSALFAYVFISNLFLAVFNLLPAFPMDGGRVLRALLATRMQYVKATTTAVVIGQAMAWLLGLYGFLDRQFFLILIAVFIYIGAGQEGQLVQVRSVLGNLRVMNAYSKRAQVLNPGSTLREAVNLTLSSFQSDFPICDGEKLVGLLTHSQVVEGLNKFGPDTQVAEIMGKSVKTVEPQDGLFQAQQIMAETRTDALPVVSRGSFLGLLTSRDINEVYRLASSSPSLLPGVNIGPETVEVSDL